MTFIKKMLSLNAKIYFSFIIVFLTFYLLIFIPQLRDLTLLYAVLYLVAEALQTGTQSDKTEMTKGAILFLIFTFVGLIVFSVLKGLVNPNNFYDLKTISIGSWIIYFLLVAVVEEEIFRNLLPKAMNNLLIPQIIYVFFHLATISLLVEEVTLTLMLPYLLFTFVFAVGMAYLTYAFKSIAPATAIHWTYDLYKIGVLMSVFGWLI